MPFAEGGPPLDDVSVDTQAIGTDD